jgi:excisionase family DNA binding protein
MERLMLTVSEVADILYLDEKTVYRIASKLPGYIKIGGSVRFNRETFLAGIKGSKPARIRDCAVADRHNLV